MGWTDTSVCLTHPRGADAVPRLLRNLEAAGIDGAWVFGYRAMQSRDFAGENDAALAVAAAHAGRLIPLALVDAAHAASEAQRVIERGARGLKILTGWSENWTPERIRRLLVPAVRMAAAAKLHVSIALEGCVPVRGGGVYLPLMLREACPDAVLALDHCWTQHAWPDYLAIAEDDPSLWITLYDLPPHLINDIVGRVGLTRCVLGSWYPEHEPRLLFERIKAALNANARTLATTLAFNAQRLLECASPRLPARSSLAGR
jgi:predicted TIM-barrel fold metal-dependent hydrolase